MNSAALTSAPDIILEAHRIFDRANALRLQDPLQPPSPQAAQIKTQAARWLTLAAQTPAPASAAQALNLAQAIDLIHRIAHTLPAPPALTSPLIIHAFNAHTHGDLSITPYDLFPHIEAALRRRDPQFLGRPLAWHSLQTQTWLRNFRNPRRPTITGTHLRNQARLLLQTDLTPYLPNPLPLLSALPTYL